MKPAEIRRLAKDHDAASLKAARAALMDGEPPPFAIEGEDDGERLTHINLALRVVGKVDAGADLKEAFREVLGGVRELLG